MEDFYEPKPTPSDYWRGIVLFGQNVASYKFALGRALLEIAATDHDAFVPLEDLAVPFSKHLVEHIREAPKQATSPSSTFLTACDKFARGELSQSALIDETVKRGFNNVIDAFHVVGGDEVPVRFFRDERTGGSRKGIRLTDAAFRVATDQQAANLAHEVEARWRLVETAWALGISRNVAQLEINPDDMTLVVAARTVRRRSVTSVRDALNGYQKGRCFYCREPLDVGGRGPTAAEVDHFLPHALAKNGLFVSLDLVWNLVLACRNCNGASGKGMRRPEIAFLRKLHDRNEFLIRSHHPLRRLLIAQMGDSDSARRQHIRDAYNLAAVLPEWRPT